MTANEDAAARQAAAGRWLRDQRRRRGFETVGEFARALDVDPSRVSNYERGKSKVPDDRADKIAELFRMSVIEVRRQLGLWLPPETATNEEPIDRLERLWREYKEDPGERGVVLRELLETWGDRDEESETG